jgi:hypothetical protein
MPSRLADAGTEPAIRASEECAALDVVVPIKAIVRTIVTHIEIDAWRNAAPDRAHEETRHRNILWPEARWLSWTVNPIEDGRW